MKNIKYKIFFIIIKNPNSILLYLLITVNTKFIYSYGYIFMSIFSLSSFLGNTLLQKLQKFLLKAVKESLFNHVSPVDRENVIHFSTKV